MAYPAATCLRPFCKKAASAASGVLQSAPSGHSKIEKIVPTETLTSMLDEPSKGSNNNRYLPWGWGSGIKEGKSISSEAIAASCPPQTLAANRISLEITSSFFWASPCTLSLPASPNTPPKLPLPMATEIAVQAFATAAIKLCKSLVKTGLLRAASVR